MPTRRTAALVLLLLTSLARPASAARTDVVTLVNGDRITGEIVVLDRGQLQFKTDDAGTIVIEWLKLTGVEANRQFEILTADGRHFWAASSARLPGSSRSAVAPATRCLFPR